MKTQPIIFCAVILCLACFAQTNRFDMKSVEAEAKQQAAIVHRKWFAAGATCAAVQIQIDGRVPTQAELKKDFLDRAWTLYETTASLSK